MTLEQTRLVTSDVATLTRFYEGVSQGKAAIINSGYVEFHSEPCGDWPLWAPRIFRHIARVSSSRGPPTSGRR